MPYTQCTMRKLKTEEGISRRGFVAGATATVCASQIDIRVVQAQPEAQSFVSPAVLRGAQGPMGVERVARLVPMGYQIRLDEHNVPHWIQVDLGQVYPLDSVKLFPVVDIGLGGIGFPVQFNVEASSNASFSSPHSIANFKGSDYPDPGDVVSVFSAKNTAARFVRVTVTKLRQSVFALSKLEVWANGRDVAEGRPVMDSVGHDLGHTLLTRKPRGQGEGVWTDNPGNIIPKSHWKRVPDQVDVPRSGVTLGPGVFADTMRNNVTYLLTSFSVDELLRPFRERAGTPVAPGLRPPVIFWDTDLPGSNAGRFLMGAGNTLRWLEDAELRNRFNQVVEGISECQAHNGYLMGYPEETIFQSERGAYTRSWVTHGLIEAGYAGHPLAFPMLRRFYDWFNGCKYLPELMRRGGQGVQGMIPSARMYFTPVGVPKDIQVVQQYYQENYWMKQLGNRQPESIWLYPYDHPHNYLITSLEPYLDQYRATGSQKYLDAALGGWELYHNNWEHVGGSIAICEFDSYPPKSYYLNKHTGELCGSVFWVKYNQRFHQLYPNQERYVNEIEKSIYNVGLANQVGGTSIRYHASIDGQKETGTSHNTCCEGQGTRLYGSLPEYVYSIASDGLYVNLFSASEITWSHHGQTLHVAMSTEFPNTPDVHLRVTVATSVKAVLHVRAPSWASAPVSIMVNGKHFASGNPGSYVALDREWVSGDTVSFTLPMALNLVRYNGADQILDRDRFAIQNGPILMALIGPASKASIELEPEELLGQLQPIKDTPLHYTVASRPELTYLPYWQVTSENFTVYPEIGRVTVPRWGSPEDNLALISKGATAQSDSEYALEPGGTEKVIDGAAPPMWDGVHRWHSSLTTPHPHWIQVTLPHESEIGWVVIRFADPAGHPVSFQGIVRVNGKDKVVFDEQQYSVATFYRAKLTPTLTDTFRLVIRASANPSYPNAAQVSSVELYPPTHSETARAPIRA